MHTFSTPEPVNLKVGLWVGEVEVTARDTDTTTVELTSMHGDDAQDLIDSARVEQRGRDIVVELPKIKGGLFRRNAGVQALIVVPTKSAAASGAQIAYNIVCVASRNRINAPRAQR